MPDKNKIVSFFTDVLLPQACHNTDGKVRRRSHSPCLLVAILNPGCSDRIPWLSHVEVLAPFQAHFQPGSSGGLPKMEAYNVRRDPGEKYGHWVPMTGKTMVVFPWKTMVYISLMSMSMYVAYEYLADGLRHGFYFSIY